MRKKFNVNVLVNKRIAEALQAVTEKGMYKNLSQAFRDVFVRGVKGLGGSWTINLHLDRGLEEIGIKVNWDVEEEEVKIPLQMSSKLKNLILDSFEVRKEKYSDSDNIDIFTSRLLERGVENLTRFYNKKRDKITIEKIFEIGLFSLGVSLSPKIVERLKRKERKRNLERWAEHHAQYGEIIGGKKVSPELAQKIIGEGGAPFYWKENGAYEVNIINPKYNKEVIACEGKSKAGYHGYYREAEIHPLPLYGGNFIINREKRNDQYASIYCYTCRGKNFVVYKWDHYYGKFECEIYIVPQVAKKYGLWNK